MVTGPYAADKSNRAIPIKSALTTQISHAALIERVRLCEIQYLCSCLLIIVKFECTFQLGSRQHEQSKNLSIYSKCIAKIAVC